MLLLFGNTATASQFYGQAPALDAWKRMYQKALNNENQMLAWIGDSQETTPNGTTAGWQERFMWNLYKRAGNKVTAAISNNMASYGGGAPYSLWLTRGASSGTGNTGYTVAEVPPGMSVYGANQLGRLSSGGSTRVLLIQLQYDASDVNPSAQVPVQNYFNPAAPFYIDIYARARPSSKEIRCLIGYNNTNAPSGGPSGGNIVDVTTSTWSPSGNLNDTAQLKKTTLGPYTNPNPVANPYAQIYMLSPSAYDGNEADLQAIVFRKATEEGGFSSVAWSLGGYTGGITPGDNSVLGKHASCAPWLQRFRKPDYTILATGTNDLYGSFYTAATIRSNFQTFLSTMRGSSWYNDLTMPFAICIDPPRNWTGDQAYVTQHNLLASELRTLCDADPYTLYIDTKKAVEAVGWRDGSAATPYLADGVHYNGLGARTMADKADQQMFFLYSSTPDNFQAYSTILDGVTDAYVLSTGISGVTTSATLSGAFVFKPELTDGDADGTLFACGGDALIDGEQALGFRYTNDSATPANNKFFIRGINGLTPEIRIDFDSSKIVYGSWNLVTFSLDSSGRSYNAYISNRNGLWQNLSATETTWTAAVTFQINPTGTPFYLGRAGDAGGGAFYHNGGLSQGYVNTGTVDWSLSAQQLKLMRANGSLLNWELQIGLGLLTAPLVLFNKTLTSTYDNSLLCGSESVTIEGAPTAGDVPGVT